MTKPASHRNKGVKTRDLAENLQEYTAAGVAAQPQR